MRRSAAEAPALGETTGAGPRAPDPGRVRVRPSNYRSCGTSVAPLVDLDVLRSKTAAVHSAGLPRPHAFGRRLKVRHDCGTVGSGASHGSRTSPAAALVGGSTGAGLRIRVGPGPHRTDRMRVNDTTTAYSFAFFDSALKGEAERGGGSLLDASLERKRWR